LLQLLAWLLLCGLDDWVMTRIHRWLLRGDVTLNLAFFFLEKVLHSWFCAAYALSKKNTRDALPLTAEGTAATQQLPSCC
jgi:hypothetical protein